ncbi:uncharacterized protein LOC117242479 [Bombus vosnesenskii]|uniref:Uncharacterized protein LOC117242479 n=2 Tax=Pyrobombus TaxID=144703 RepID=A0A6J3LI64_9HYME|nr:uncharacterized protein LOC117214294 [Bombus bifarius]XP_033365077.1 uncharacterized protein LOC117242479 [Bombus vosnesenskii]XP_050493323.1 uncharacterized protein LOC126874849 [Bombus huntii]
MPVESSIYWDSIGSQRSTSVGSSGDAYSSGSASRHYVDPWDLENYVYLRRHSVANLAQQMPLHHRRPTYRLSQEATPAQSEYWYSSSVREPGYDAPAFVEELYCGPARLTNNSCYYHQPIYEDEVPDYVAPFPVYAPLSEARHGEFMEDHRRFGHKYKSTSMRELHRSVSVDANLPPMDSIELDMPDYRSQQEYTSMEQEKYMVEIIPPPHLDLNTYGHLKIDYTNSWNSLNRKIRK